MELSLTQDQLKQLLVQAAGTRVKIIDQSIVNRAHDYLVLVVKLIHPSTELVIKLAGPHAHMASSFDRTAMLNRMLAAQTSIPMADVLAVNTSLQAWPWRYLITAYIPGQEWASVRLQMDSVELARAYHQIGDAVAQLHAIQFGAFGELDGDGSVLEPQPYLEALTGRARRSIRNTRLSDAFLSLLEKHTALFADIHQPRLCHEDLHGYNILFVRQQGKWQLATILDFDKAWAGHHEIDLARMEFWDGMTSREFWQAYQARFTIDPLYKERRPLYQLLWCFEYAQSTPRHLQDTRRLCEYFGIPSPRAFD